jgi:hypothetical protein
VRFLRALFVVGIAAGYVAALFQLRGPFWTAGLGDWMDPYFINYLLEHWYRSVTHGTSPASPPMYYPAAGTLGHSHGLILYAPLYIAVRAFLHPFQAYNVTLFLVVLGGTVSLYAVLRKLGLSFLEALLLTALFATSPNIANGFLGIWSQRASVFLIPPVVLLGLRAAEMSPGRPRTAVAALVGLLTALLYVQDYYTAHLALLLAALLLVPAVTMPPKSWLVPFGAGAVVGTGVFLWIYLRPYRVYGAFPEEQVLGQLLPWGARGYESYGSFVLAGGLALLIRSRFAAWLAVVSLLVFLIPYRFGDLSPWRLLIGPLPGFDVIRDPKRIIYLYELAVVLAAGVLLAQLRDRRVTRLAATALVAVVLAASWRPATLDFLRPNETYARWVEAPVAIDPACRSFFIAPASERYTARADSAWSVYHLDAMWLSLERTLPTLNGYSAWNPPDWAIGDPNAPGYLDAVRDWTTRHDLEDVCVLDIEARTISRPR